MWKFSLGARQSKQKRINTTVQISTWRQCQGRRLTAHTLLQELAPRLCTEQRESWQGCLLTYIPKQSRAGLGQHPAPLWCLCKPKQLWPPAHYGFLCNGNHSCCWLRSQRLQINTGTHLPFLSLISSLWWDWKYMHQRQFSYHLQPSFY